MFRVCKVLRKSSYQKKQVGASKAKIDHLKKSSNVSLFAGPNFPPTPRNFVTARVYLAHQIDAEN